MPIDYDHYPDGWHEFSRWVREERAGDRCEWCGVPNHVYRNEDGEITEDDMLAESWSCVDGLHVIWVVLTVAHLDQDHTHMDPERVAALCQACHNRLDAPVRAHRRRYGREFNGPHQQRLLLESDQ